MMRVFDDPGIFICPSSRFARTARLRVWRYPARIPIGSNAIHPTMTFSNCPDTTIDTPDQIKNTSGIIMILLMEMIRVFVDRIPTTNRYAKIKKTHTGV
jgi:hypothetical protein